MLFAMAGTVASSRFVGRTAELGRLEAAFAHARGGEPLTLCIGGEAGVGKTRLITRFAGQVRQAADRCCSAGVELVSRAAVRARGPGAPRAGPGAGAGGAGRAGRAGTPAAGPPAGSGRRRAGVGRLVGEQARLFEALLALLGHLAGRSSTVLVVEDLHWADRSTLDLLAFLVRNLQAGLLLVLTSTAPTSCTAAILRPFLADWTTAAGPTGSRLAASAVPTSATCWPASSARTRQRPCRADLPLGERAFFAEELLAATRRRRQAQPAPSLKNVLLSRVHDLPERRRPCGWWPRPAAGSSTSCSSRSATCPRPACWPRCGPPSPTRCSSPTRPPRPTRCNATLTQEALYGELLPGGRSRLHAAFARVLAERQAGRGRPRRRAGPARLPLGQGPRAGSGAARGAARRDYESRWPPTASPTPRATSSSPWSCGTRWPTPPTTRPGPRHRARARGRRRLPGR